MREKLISEKGFKLLLFFLVFSLLVFGSFSYGAGLYNLGAFWHPRITFGKNWAWISGASTTGQTGVYGTQGTGSTSNVPGARSGSAMWMDSSSNIWIFGGIGYPASGGTGEINDLWKYAPGSSQWTWIGGASIVTQAGTYGTKGTGSTSNIPSSGSSFAPIRAGTSGFSVGFLR